MNWRLDERGALSITELDGMGRAVTTCGPFFPAVMPGDDEALTCAGQPVTTTHRDEQGRVERVTMAGIRVHDGPESPMS